MSETTEMGPAAAQRVRSGRAGPHRARVDGPDQHVDMSLSLAAMRSMSDLLGAMPAGPALGVAPGTSALPPSA